MATFPAYPPPASATRGHRKPNILKAQFGDGYPQVSKKGINNTMSDWNMVWTNRSRDDLNIVDDFLTARGGAEKFDYVLPYPFNDITRYFRCEEWDWTYDQGLIISGITATFIEVPPI